jgi:hypothetical protein
MERNNQLRLLMSSPLLMKSLQTWPKAPLHQQEGISIAATAAWSMLVPWMASLPPALEGLPPPSH